MTTYELLLIGGGAGVGKTTVAWEVSAVLQARGTAHCLIEGDYMDQIHPAPDDDPHRAAITKRSLRMARHLSQQAPADSIRIPTDARPVQDIALDVLQAAAW